MNHYIEAGVNIDVGEDVVKRLKKNVQTSYDASVIGGLGGFGSLYDAAVFKKYQEPVLVQSVDGVGTKIKMARMMGVLNTVGQDLVNHCCNDILCQGAKPLTFLDYVAASKLSAQEVADVVSGIDQACRANGLSLVGGETAELPGLYREGEYDLAGCITGIVEKEKMITGQRIASGDTVLGLASSGLHTNGYSLARHIFFTKYNFSLSHIFGELRRTLGEELLQIHRSYLTALLPLVDRSLITGLAHITGGGLPGNVPRIVPSRLVVEIQKDSWPLPPIFDLIQRLGGVSSEEMYRVFNMGIGMVVLARPKDVFVVMRELEAMGEKVYEIGRVVESHDAFRFV